MDSIHMAIMNDNL